MNEFFIKDNFLVLAKYLKNTKPNEKGESKQYGTISLYCPDKDQFQKIMVFDNYQEILGKYEVNNIYEINMQVNINPETKKVFTKIL